MEHNLKLPEELSKQAKVITTALYPNLANAVRSLLAQAELSWKTCEEYAKSASLFEEEGDHTGLQFQKWFSGYQESVQDIACQTIACCDLVKHLAPRKEGQRVYWFNSPLHSLVLDGYTPNAKDIERRRSALVHEFQRLLNFMGKVVHQLQQEAYFPEASEILTQYAELLASHAVKAAKSLRATDEVRWLGIHSRTKKRLSALWHASALRDDACALSLKEKEPDPTERSIIAPGSIG